METLKLLRASAGSGKTFAIAEAYLKLLFAPNSSELKFKQILAVTFTNKATEEMKSRIVENLVYLAKGEFDLEDSVALPLLKLNDNNKENLKKRAKNLLSIILHNYSYFNIKTIDSFAQNLLRNFYFELKMHPAYDVELDNTSAQKFLINKLVTEAETHDHISKWIFELIDSKIEDEKAWSFYDELSDLTKAIFTEKFHKIEPEIKALSIDDLKNTNKLIKDRKNKISKELISKAKEIMDIVKKTGIPQSEYKGGAKGPLSIPRKVSEVIGNLSISNNNLNMTKTYIDWMEIEDCKKFFKGKCDPDNACEIKDLLQPYLVDFYKILTKHKQEYYTVSTLGVNIYLFGLFIELADYIHEYRDDNNVLFSNDVNKLLHSLIQDNDVSFIYEKAGEKYQNFMIDEFQDTSTYQWEIYRPLVSNSLGNNNSNLIVGDIKQAIYRWREGNFNLLLNQVKEDISYHNYAEIIKEESLKYNWRSDARIISFNNYIFNFMPIEMQSIYNEKIDNSPVSNNYTIKAKEDIKAMGYRTLLTDIYRDTQQLTPPNKLSNPKGLVEINLVEGINPKVHKEKEIIGELVNEKIAYLIVEKGVSPGDIVILADKKKNLYQSITSLLSYWDKHNIKPQIEVVSENSLMLRDSVSIKIIQACYNYMYSSDDLYLREIAYNYSIVLNQTNPQILTQSNLKGLIPDNLLTKIAYWRQLPLYESLQYILSFFGLDKAEKYASFVTAYSEKLYNYTQKYGNDLHDYLDWWQEKSDKMFVSMTDSSNAIHALTIHKSKGLAFEHVFLPHSNMSLARTGNKENIWVHPSYLKVPFPVKYGENLSETEFVFEYLEEMGNKMVDSLNMFYVACTRAISGLYIYGKAKVYDSKNKKPPTTISQLLYNLIHLKPEINNKDEGFYYDKFILKPERIEKTIGDNDFIIQSTVLGSIDKKKEEKTDIAEIPSLSIKTSNNWSKLITIRKKSSKLFDEDSSNTKRLEGTILHKILSYINVADDIESAIDKLVTEAWITNDDKKYYRDIIKTIIYDNAINPFFNAIEVINERTIISKDYGLKIPDRVVKLSNGEYWVLDYKFSNQHAIKKHKRQIKDYQILLEEITNQPVKTGIIYYDYESVELVT